MIILFSVRGDWGTTSRETRSMTSFRMLRIAESLKSSRKLRANLLGASEILSLQETVDKLLHVGIIFDGALM